MSFLSLPTSSELNTLLNAICFTSVYVHFIYNHACIIISHCGKVNKNDKYIHNTIGVHIMSDLPESKKVNIELEIDTKTVDSSKNPYQGWIHMARAVDAWRIFPRLFLSVYVFLLYYSTMWFMGLENPSLEQSGLISIIVGAGAAWFGLYAGTDKDKSKD